MSNRFRDMIRPQQNVNELMNERTKQRTQPTNTTDCNTQWHLESTATRSCRDPKTAVIHNWLPGSVRRRPQRVTSAGSGSRRDTLRLPPLLVRPGAAATAPAAAATAGAMLRLLLVLLYSQFGD